jgi:PAS domain-containing protein
MAQLDIELILARHLISRLAVPVLLVDARGDTLFFNEPAEPIFGYRFDEFERMPFEERTSILAPRDARGSRLPVSRLPGIVAMRQRRPSHAAFQIRDLHGAAHAIEATAIPLESADGQILGAMVVLWPRRGRSPVATGKR